MREQPQATWFNFERSRLHPFPKELLRSLVSGAPRNVFQQSGTSRFFDSRRRGGWWRGVQLRIAV